VQINFGFRPQSVGLDVLQQQVGPGWSGIIRRLVEDIEEMGWNGTVIQVKEKFGGLRFYIGSSSDAVHVRISAAEAESYTICEECGEPGARRYGGWIKTLCDQHENDRQFRYRVQDIEYLDYSQHRGNDVVIRWRKSRDESE